MQPVRARVVGGRLRVDEPTDLPEGSEVDLSPAEPAESAEERAEIVSALEDAMDDIERGDQGAEAFAFLAKLRRR